MNELHHSDVSLSSDEDGGEVNTAEDVELKETAPYESPKTPIPLDLELDEPPHEIFGSAPSYSSFPSQSPQSAGRKQHFEKEAQKLLLYVKDLVLQNDELQKQIEKQHEMINHLDMKIAEDRDQMTIQHKKETETLQQEKAQLENKVRQYETQLKSPTHVKDVSRHQSPSTPLRSGVAKLPLHSKTSPSTPSSKTTPSATKTPKSASPHTVGSVEIANQIVTDLRKQLATANAKIKKLQQEGQVWEKLVTHYESMLGVVKVSVATDEEETEEQH